MFVNTTAIGLVIGPIAVIDITIDVDETAFAVSSVLSPLSAVFGSIIPGLLAKTIAETTLPLACVDGS